MLTVPFYREVKFTEPFYREIYVYSTILQRSLFTVPFYGTLSLHCIILLGISSLQYYLTQMYPFIFAMNFPRKHSPSILWSKKQYDRTSPHGIETFDTTQAIDEYPYVTRILVN